MSLWRTSTLTSCGIMSGSVAQPDQQPLPHAIPELLHLHCIQPSASTEKPQGNNVAIARIWKTGGLAEVRRGVCAGRLIQSGTHAHMRQGQECEGTRTSGPASLLGVISLWLYTSACNHLPVSLGWRAQGQSARVDDTGQSVFCLADAIQARRRRERQPRLPHPSFLWLGKPSPGWCRH